MPEEALFSAFEGGSRRGFCLTVQRPSLAGNVGGSHRSVEVVMDDAECASVGVIDTNLLGCELVFDKLVFDALIRQRARNVEAERLEVSGQHFHGRDTALLDHLDEFSPGGEWKILTAP